MICFSILRSTLASIFSPSGLSSLGLFSLATGFGSFRLAGCGSLCWNSALYLLFVTFLGGSLWVLGALLLASLIWMGMLACGAVRDGASSFGKSIFVLFFVSSWRFGVDFTGLGLSYAACFATFCSTVSMSASTYISSDLAAETDLAADSGSWFDI